jgi:hypothetical protein
VEVERAERGERLRALGDGAFICASVERRLRRDVGGGGFGGGGRRWARDAVERDVRDDVHGVDGGGDVVAGDLVRAGLDVVRDGGRALELGVAERARVIAREMDDGVFVLEASILDRENEIVEV